MVFFRSQIESSDRAKPEQVSCGIQVSFPLKFPGAPNTPEHTISNLSQQLCRVVPRRKLSSRKF